MRRGESLIYEWPDGHQLKQDPRQWIVVHPRTCKNAQRGGDAYAKETYLTTERGLLWELGLCKIALPTEKRVAFTIHPTPRVGHDLLE